MFHAETHIASSNAPRTTPAPLARVDGLPITLADEARAVRAIIADARAARSFAVHTLNLDHLHKCRRDARFRAAYLKARHITADGWPVVWLARRHGATVRRVTGADLLWPLMEMAAVMDVPVAFLGSTPRTLARAEQKLRHHLPGLRVMLRLSPPHGFDPTGELARAMLARLDESGARLCVLALGAPKQELLAARGVAAGVRCGFLCFGAALDFIAGTQRRAPVWMRRAGVEWLWRMITNPRRLARRYAGNGVLFARLAARELLRETKGERHVRG